MDDGHGSRVASRPLGMQGRRDPPGHADSRSESSTGSAPCTGRSRSRGAGAHPRDRSGVARRLLLRSELHAPLPERLDRPEHLRRLVELEIPTIVEMLEDEPPILDGAEANSRLTAPGQGLRRLSFTCAGSRVPIFRPPLRSPPMTKRLEPRTKLPRRGPRRRSSRRCARIAAGTDPCPAARRVGTGRSRACRVQLPRSRLRRARVAVRELHHLRRVEQPLRQQPAVPEGGPAFVDDLRHALRHEVLRLGRDDLEHVPLPGFRARRTAGGNGRCRGSAAPRPPSARTPAAAAARHRPSSARAPCGCARRGSG